MFRKVRVGKTFEFDCAHHLPNHRGKCKQVHGHRYRLLVEVEGEIVIDQGSPEWGMVIDYRTLVDMVRPVVDGFDHTNLNDTIPNPTAENLLLVIVERLKRDLNNNFLERFDLELTKVVLWETPNSYAEWRGSKQ